MSIEEEMEGCVWNGDWSAGERPEGYISTTAKKRKLEGAGIEIPDFFSENFSIDYGIIIGNLKKGYPLSQEDLDNLLKYNKEVNSVLDRLILDNNL